MDKIYLISSGSKKKHFKIGFTRRDIKKRMLELRTGNSEEITIISFFESEWAKEIEKSFHKILRNKKIQGEWFLLEKEDIENFIPICDKLHRTCKKIFEENTWLEEKKRNKKSNLI